MKEQGCRSGSQPPTGELARRLASRESERQALHQRHRKELSGNKAA